MILQIVGILLAIVSLGVGALVLSILWVAAGSPDVNGDPERDAGYSEDEISDLSASWDHGSRRTADSPGIEYARRMNREALRRAAGL